MKTVNIPDSIKCLVLLTAVFLAGCNIGISEEGQDRCLRYARDQKNDFAAKKVYERCLKNVMAVLRREKQAEKRRKAERERRDALARLRSEVGLQQYYKLQKYKNWQYWPNRLAIDNSSLLAASCVVLTESGTSTELITSLDDTRNNFTECAVRDSLYFTEDGFQIASIFSHKTEGRQQFDIIEHDIDCGRLAHIRDRNIATIISSKVKSPGVFKNIEGLTDPFTNKYTLPTSEAAVSVWSGEWRKSQGLSKEREGNLVKPFCDLHKKFWSESGESFVKSFSV